MIFGTKSRILLLPVLVAATTLHAEEAAEKSIDVYECTIVKYESEKSSTKEDAIEPFKVARNGKNNPVPAPAVNTGEGDEQLSWRVTRYDNLISVEVADADGKVLSISTTTDGNPIGLKVPSTKNILTCNPPEKDGLKTNPKSYGVTERMERLDIERLKADLRAYGVTKRMERLEVDPRAYGERKFNIFNKKFSKRTPIEEALLRKDGESAQEYKSRVMAHLENELKTAQDRGDFDGTGEIKEVITTFINTLNDMDEDAFVAVFAIKDAILKLANTLEEIKKSEK